MQASLSTSEVVLIGAGHTNAHVVRGWGMHPIPGARLTVVSPFSIATYSGMLPGVLAGLYDRDDFEIDLHRLTVSCGARLIVAEAIGLDPVRKLVEFRDRPSIPYDVVSIGIGSQPAGRTVYDGHEHVVPVKPMQTFLDRLEAVVQSSRARRTGGALRVVVVGGGAGGTEVAMCLRPWFARRHVEADITLVDSSDAVPSGFGARTQRLVAHELKRARVALRTGFRVAEVTDHGLESSAGTFVAADVVVWAAGATAPPGLERFGLPRDERGFLAVDETLRTTAGHDVFVVGDTAAIVGEALPKAGVYAVRQGPVLWENLRRTLDGRPLKPYRPQRRFLSLLATGDGRAIGRYGPFAACGRWLWRWKDRIDRRFVERFRNVRSMSDSQTVPVRAPRVPMRCAGCGGKAGAAVLVQAVEEFVPERWRDDAARLDPSMGPIDLVTTDAFTAFCEDPFLVGRVAALHAASDIWATGGTPVAATAHVTLPAGPTARQAELLRELLAGSHREFDRFGVAIVGGHTREGEETAIGFTVLGRLDDRTPTTLNALRPGDRLLLTKPLGTGTLLVARMRSAARARWIDALFETMLVPNAAAAEAARAHDVKAATDVTGFGLAGHLIAMLEASGVSAKLSLDAVPLLDGFTEMSAAGHRSSLEPSNREAESRMEFDGSAVIEHPSYAALFDPQTAGGLLLGASESDAPAVLAALHQAGCEAASVVGEVTARAAESRLVVSS